MDKSIIKSPWIINHSDDSSLPSTQDEKVLNSGAKSLKDENNPKIFEEFFIIGADIKAIESCSSKIKGNVYFEPKVIFQYPDLPENKDW